jgi:hypothetical protein
MTLYPYVGLVKVYGVAFAETIRWTFALLWAVVLFVVKVWEEN